MLYFIVTYFDLDLMYQLLTVRAFFRGKKLKVLKKQSLYRCTKRHKFI